MVQKSSKNKKFKSSDGGNRLNKEKDHSISEKSKKRAKAFKNKSYHDGFSDEGSEVDIEKMKDEKKKYRRSYSFSS